MRERGCEDGAGAPGPPAPADCGCSPGCEGVAPGPTALLLSELAGCGPRRGRLGWATAVRHHRLQAEYPPFHCNAIPESKYRYQLSVSMCKVAEMNTEVKKGP